MEQVRKIKTEQGEFLRVDGKVKAGDQLGLLPTIEEVL